MNAWFVFVVWWAVPVFDSIIIEDVSPIFEEDWYVWWVYMGLSIVYFVWGFVKFWLILINHEYLEDLGAEAVKWLALNNDWYWNEDKLLEISMEAWFEIPKLLCIAVGVPSFYFTPEVLSIIFRNIKKLEYHEDSPGLKQCPFFETYAKAEDGTFLCVSDKACGVEGSKYECQY